AGGGPGPAQPPRAAGRGGTNRTPRRRGRAEPRAPHRGAARGQPHPRKRRRGQPLYAQPPPRLTVGLVLPLGDRPPGRRRLTRGPGEERGRRPLRAGPPPGLGGRRRRGLGLGRLGLRGFFVLVLVFVGVRRVVLRLV